MPTHARPETKYDLCSDESDVTCCLLAASCSHGKRTCRHLMRTAFFLAALITGCVSTSPAPRVIHDANEFLFV